jgi:hypothetical protein
MAYGTPRGRSATPNYMKQGSSRKKSPFKKLQEAELRLIHQKEGIVAM